MPRVHSNVELQSFKTEGKKFCPGCDQILVLDLFGKNRQHSDGRSSECKACRRLRRKLDYRHKGK